MPVSPACCIFWLQHTYSSIVHILRLFLLIVGAMSVTDFTNLINVDVDDPHVLDAAVMNYFTHTEIAIIILFHSALFS